jgi:signal transduction histidine kinase
MKYYHYVSILAIVIIVCLQGFYVSLQYDDFMDRKITEIEKIVRNSIDEELDLRSRKDYKPDKIGEQHFYFRVATPQERKKIQGGKDKITIKSIDIMKLRKEGIASTTAEAMALISQDYMEKKGRAININVIDTIFSRHLSEKYKHAVLLLDANKKVIKKTCPQSIPKNWETTQDYAVNLQTPRFIRVAIDITPSDFIKDSILGISLSVLFALVIVGCVGYQLIVIRRKEELLHNRELSINGTIHDLKAPLNSVVALLDMLKYDIEDNETNALVQQTEDRTKSLVTMIETLLITARGTSKKIALKKEPADLCALSERAKRDVDVLYANKPHHIVIVNHTDEKIKPLVDIMYMENVMLNLIENAVKYADDGVTVDVILENTDSYISIIVKDTGWGIEKKYQKHIFEQFYRVPHKSASKGYGIGLALVKYILESHDGQISVESKIGKGSQFTITLPLT